MKIKIFKTTVPDKGFQLQQVQDLFNQIQKWSEENPVAPKSIGSIDLSDEDLLVSVAYETENPYPVTFSVQSVGWVTPVNDKAPEEVELKVNDLEGIADSIGHSLLVAPGDDALYMVLMKRK